MHATPSIVLRRRWLVITLVLLGHAGAIGWLSQNLSAPRVTPPAADHILQADVILSMPPSVTPPQAAKASATARPPPHPLATQAAQNMPNPIAQVASAVQPASTSVAADLPLRATSAAPTPDTVTLPSSDADYLHNPPPAYPRMSRRLGEQGTVVLHVYIGTDGRAEKAEIRSSSGYPRLDEAALAGIQSWRFVPGTRNGVAQAMWFNLPLRFVLD